jgi:putative colanic acid biosynthesis acetyltransferase WcaF
VSLQQTEPNSSARAPYPLWTYLGRALWLVVQATVWRLAWKRIRGLRGGILRMFGASTPCAVLISEGVRVYFPWSLGMGRHVAIGPRVDFYNLGGVRLGDRVVISQDVYFCGGAHEYTDPRYPLIRRAIVVEDDVWIGAGAFIGPGVTVGQGAVVGARAVVMKDVPPWKVVAGNPARVIKERVLRAS